MFTRTASQSWILSFCLLSVLYHLDTVTCDCSDLESADNSFLQINETTQAGYVLLNISKNVGQDVSFVVSQISQNRNLTSDRRNEIKNKYFKLTQEDTRFVMYLNSTLDLELLFKDFNVVATTIVLQVKCGSINYEITIANTQVNEFQPVFINAPYSVTVEESKPIHSSVYDLSSSVQDSDIPPPSTFYYKIHRYLIDAIDGSNNFEIPTTTRGVVAIKSPLDYDTLERKNLFLNVSVADENSATTKPRFTYINITVTDADDQAPYFDYPGCSKPCVAPPYEALVAPDYSGDVPVEPAAIKAKDDDTLGTHMFFSIQGNNYNMFAIDAESGVVTLTRSVLNSGLKNYEFRLIIQVRKDTALDLSSIAILTVKVKGREGNGTGTIVPEDSPEKKGTGLLIPVIILGVLLVILIIATVIIFILMRRKQKQMLVSPEHDQSEPQTEEEEIHDTDRSEEYNTVADTNEKQMYGKTTRGISTDMYPTPTGKAKRLPPLPLKDTGTEMTEERKKKRSRKRNKKKEPEIFDGTREYNMGLEPEFFDSTDKSKVKRSQRSKKADSTLPINVPNDQPPEYELVQEVHNM